MVVRIQPQPGQQTKAAKTRAQVLVYGGAAGGGKTWFQAYHAARYYRVRNYHAMLQRRTHVMLKAAGSMWDQCSGLYPMLGGKQAYPRWRWPQYGSKVEFSHLQHDASASGHKSAQYAYLGQDEATDFSRHQREMMRSRVRTTCGVPTREVYTTNPDPDSDIREWLGDFYIGSDGMPRPEHDGVIRFFARIGDDLVWRDNHDDLLKYVRHPKQIKSFTFIRADVTDNAILMAQGDGEYLGQLENMPPVMRARFRAGNWDAREAAGDMFQRSWFPTYGETELVRTLIGQAGPAWDIVDAIRFWDRAASPVSKYLVPNVPRPSDFQALAPGSRAKEPDWTFGVRVVRFRNGKRCLWDAVAYQDSPGAIEQAMIAQAVADGPRTAVGYWQDPAQAGIDQAQRMAEQLKRKAACDVWYQIQNKSKTEYAREPSRASYRQEILQRTSNAADPSMRLFWNQMETFPPENDRIKDDGPDAFCGAELYFTETPLPEYSGFEPVRYGADGRPAPHSEGLVWLPPDLDRDSVYGPGTFFRGL